MSLLSNASFTIKKYTVYIALAGPYPKDPVSALGHVFLVIAPANSEAPFLNWMAINFAADTENATWYNYYIKGASGSFNAYYYTLSVHEKIMEYVGSETRDIRFFPLEISEKEYHKLEKNLSDWSETPYHYKFFTYNCADGIYYLLYSSLNSLPPPTIKIMAPQDVVLILQKENRLGDPYLLSSLRERVLSATDKEQAELEFLEWENSQKTAVKDILREKRMAELRYSISQKSNKERRDLFKLEESWTKPHGYSRLDIGPQIIDGKINTHIRFRPLLHDPSDNSGYYSAYSTLELLSFGLNLNNTGINLQEFTLLHIRSAPIYDSIFRSLSWDVFVSYKHGIHKLNLGIGKSFYVSEKRKIALELLLLNSIKYDDNFSNFTGFESQLNKRLVDDFRYGVKFEYLHRLTNFENKHIQFTKWISYDVNRNFNLYAEVIFDIKKQKIIGLYSRFYI